MSQDPNLPGGVTDRMLDDEAEGYPEFLGDVAWYSERCECGHREDQHDHDTADGSYGEPYVVTLACEVKGCPCKKFRRAD